MTHYQFPIEIVKIIYGYTDDRVMRSWVQQLFDRSEIFEWRYLVVNPNPIAMYMLFERMNEEKVDWDSMGDDFWECMNRNPNIVYVLDKIIKYDSDFIFWDDICYDSSIFYSRAKQYDFGYDRIRFD